eukprot:scaffold103582_cov55-Phaeocystis_antarctica.AAC.1
MDRLRQPGEWCRKHLPLAQPARPRQRGRGYRPLITTRSRTGTRHPAASTSPITAPSPRPEIDR